MAYMLNGCIGISTTHILEIPDSVANIDYIYDGTSITNLDNLVIGSGITSATSWNPANLRTINNMVIKNNIVKFTGNTLIQSAENLTRPNSTNWDSYFEGCTSLRNDVDFPLNTRSAKNCYKGCTSLTHVHSNWLKTYPNGITPTDCYAGCINITHIDNEEIGVNEYINGLDEIPSTWGGNEFYKAHTGIYRVKIPRDNYVWSTYGTTDNGNTFPLIANKIVDWGDGSVTTGTGTHTYAKAGEYIIRGNLTLTRKNYGADQKVRETLTEIMQFPTSVTGYSEFYYCSLLKKANISGGTFRGFCFRLCGALEEVICTNTVFEGNISGLFDSCSNLRKLNIEDAKFLNITSADTMFAKCRSLTALNLGHMDLTSATNLNNFISNAELLSSFNAPKNISVSFKDFTYSIKLGHDDLMTIINNLSAVSTTQTLTLGRTNLAKLTTDEIRIAVDKGWTVV